MITYVVVYSIVLFVLAATVVALSVFYVSKKRRLIEKEWNKARSSIVGERAFVDLVGSTDRASFMLFEEQTLKPLYISPNIKNILGVSAEELYVDTESVRKTFGIVEVHKFRREFERWTRDDEMTYDFAYGGEGKHARMSAVCADSQGKKYILVIISDVSQEVDTIASMRLELEDAVRRASEKSSFLSNMSHEIRTPMNGVIGMMSLARMNIHDTERVEQCLDKAGYLANFLIGMINDILDISKIESGRMQLYNSDFDIFALADKMRNMFSSTMQSKGVDYNVETVDFTARVLVGDELRLTQVITNLVSNAQKFTPAGGKVTVTFKQLDRIGNNVNMMIRVRDTGKGIAPEAIHKIMKPFEQEEASTSHKYGGTGLGLAITENFVKLMGGNIVIDSELGKGSDFSVFLSLPIADVDQDMSMPVEDGEVVADVQFSYKDCRILLAEDNDINAEIAVEILESEGAKVTLARDGQELVDIFTSKPPHTFDLLLVDIQMPKLDGREATRIIRASGAADAKDVVIVALSADAFVEDVVLSENAGMDGHVAKPVDFDALEKRVGEIFTLKKSGKGTENGSKKKRSSKKKN